MKRKQRLRPISQRLRQEKALYRPERDEFLRKNPVCWVCVALAAYKPVAAIEVHHTRGRAGKYLRLQEFWVPICRSHHDVVNYQPAWAKEHGWLGPWLSLINPNYEKEQRQKSYPGFEQRLEALRDSNYQ